MSKVKGKLAQAITGKKPKRRAVKKPVKKSATQEGVKFSKDKDIQDGTPSREEIRIDAELRTADVAKGSRKPSVTVGSKSEAGGVVEESTSKGAKARAKEIVRLETLVRQGKATKADKAKLKRMRDKDVLDTVRAEVKGAATRRGTKKPKRTDYVDPETGEIFGTPTKNQLMVAARNARARGMTNKEREYRAFLEKEYGVQFYAGGIADKRYVNLVTTVDRRKKK